MSKTKVVHLSSVHSRYDIRIFIKMCTSLSKKGYDVSLLVADGKGNEIKNGIKIIDVGKPKNRFFRMICSSAKVYKMALRLNAEIYHIHDPELLPYAYLLVKKGKKVIFDSHEDVPRQLLTKDYFPNVIKKVVSYSYEIIQNLLCKNLTYIIAATPFIEKTLEKVNVNIITLKNYPIQSELFDTTLSVKKENFNSVCYLGGISKARGFYSMVDSIKYTLPQIKLNIGGKLDTNRAYMDYILQSQNKLQINSLGFVDRIKAKELLANSFAGLVILLPLPSYVVSLPIKMFEYMSAGLPVIASNFPLWKKIIEGNKCGICVNPESPKEIAEAINYLYTHPEEAKQMGENGRKAVLEKFNWSLEEEKLIKLYEEITNL